MRLFKYFIAFNLLCTWIPLGLGRELFNYKEKEELKKLKAPNYLIEKNWRLLKKNRRRMFRRLLISSQTELIRLTRQFKKKAPLWKILDVHDPDYLDNLLRKEIGKGKK